MPVLLHLDSSANLSTSRTRELTAEFARIWTERSPDHRTVYRDLHRDQLPHLETAAQHLPEQFRHGAAVSPEAERQQQALVDELLAADVLLVGAPMYNFSMPSTLKAWIDNIHIPGVTSPLAEPTQPLAGRPAVIVVAQGAAYDPGSPTADWDHGTPALTLILGNSLGMDVSVITTSRTLAAMNPALDPDQAARELTAAREQCAQLATTV
ncbi:MAG: FMN-dependent NADH-azoreductase [Propioniciclava sp.]